MDEPVLKTQAQQDAAKKWVSGEVDRAVAFLTTQHDYSSQGEIDAAETQARQNLFFGKVTTILQNAEGRFQKDDSKKKKFVEDSLSQLKVSSIETLKQGEKPEGFFDILSKGFQSFDVWHPVDSIKSIFIHSVKAFAVLLGGNMAAPWLRSMRSTYLDKKPMTSTQAAEILKFENAATALAHSLGHADAKLVSSIAGNVGQQIYAIESTKPPEGQKSPASSTDPVSSANNVSYEGDKKDKNKDGKSDSSKPGEGKDGQQSKANGDGKPRMPENKPEKDSDIARQTQAAAAASAIMGMTPIPGFGALGQLAPLMTGASPNNPENKKKGSPP